MHAIRPHISPFPLMSLFTTVHYALLHDRAHVKVSNTSLNCTIVLYRDHLRHINASLRMSLTSYYFWTDSFVQTLCYFTGTFPHLIHSLYSPKWERGLCCYLPYRAFSVSIIHRYFRNDALSFSSLLVIMFITDNVSWLPVSSLWYWGHISKIWQCLQK